MAKKKSAKKASAAKAPAANKKRATAPTKKSGKPKRSESVTPAISLGRPKVTAEEKLFMLFKEDYHARQIFEFLRAETVRDLEQFTPDEIVRQLSQPIKKTVERIRLRLAEKNRSLRDDQEFAARHSQPDEL